jgi:hypothetical protein
VFNLGGGYLLWIFVESLILILGGIILSIIYDKSIKKLTAKIAKRFSKFIRVIFNKIEIFLLKKLN